MLGISIIIVNYNVKYFLRQCLQSIYASNYDGSLEVIVVDNNSQDGSQEMLSKEFPQVKLIDSKENLGFSKANNLAIKQAKNPHTLILNPDTILEENTLETCQNYLGQLEDAGAIVVKMVDGSGTYLPESKRGFPTPQSALYKLSGLARIFPRSSIFNHYYLGHLDKKDLNEIEVLTGAFCYMPTTLIQEIGGFDEDYFMYGEDIELSFQIKQKNKKIYYIPSTQIIHFKGESTKKLGRKYLSSFYGAMKIYSLKRNATGSFLWSWILNLGILVSAIVGISKKLLLSVLRPVIDLFCLFSVAKLIQAAWAYWYHNEPAYYDHAETTWLYFALVGVVISCYYFFGQYDRRHNLKHLSYGFVFSSFLVLSIYSLLPEAMRFSRVILLSTLIVAPFILYLTRKIYNYLWLNTSAFDTVLSKRVGVVGSASAYNKIEGIVKHFSEAANLVGRISSDNETDKLGSIEDLGKIVESRKINELIFCSSDVETHQMFGAMAKIGNQVSYKVANNDNTAILGSDSKERVGEWYTLNIDFKINQPFHIRSKRLFDISFSCIFILFAPLIFVISKNRMKIYSKIVSVLFGYNTWIGYHLPDKNIKELPDIKSGVFGIATTQSERDNHQTNLWYARNYSIWSEIAMIFKKVL